MLWMLNWGEPGWMYSALDFFRTHAEAEASRLSLMETNPRVGASIQAVEDDSLWTEWNGFREVHQTAREHFLDHCTVCGGAGRYWMETDPAEFLEVECVCRRVHID